jgi:hypothetical protein
MARGATVCPTPGCPNLKPCPIHKPTPWAGSNRSHELPAKWGTLRLQVLERDHRCCTATDHDPRCDGTANEVHHLGAADDHRPHMLASLNPWCHKVETQAEAAAARRARQP